MTKRIKPTSQHGLEVTLVITSNDGNEALALCMENDDVVSFPRGTVSKTQFKKDLPVGFQAKCKRFAASDYATARLAANQLRQGLTAAKMGRGA